MRRSFVRNRTTPGREIARPSDATASTTPSSHRRRPERRIFYSKPSCVPTGVRIVALLLVALSSHAYGESAADRYAPCAQVAAGMNYDVVAIHPSRGEEGNYSVTWGDDRYRGINILLIQLVAQAYGLREDQITGIGGPVATIHYDVEAKALAADPNTPVKLTDRQLQCMLIPLLADRFHLKAHTEIKTGPIFELVVAKSGARLTAAAPDIKNGGIGTAWDGSTETITVTAALMQDFASMLAQDRQRSVIDRTGLPGRYTFSLKWLRDGTADTPRDAPPGLFTALEEQLGLRLQPTKGPVDTLVVEHVETPTAN